MRKLVAIVFFLALFVFTNACNRGSSDDDSAAPTPTPTPTPVLGIIHLNFVSHNEESVSDPDYTSSSVFSSTRALVKQMGDTIYNKGAKWNFQSDWKFIKGVQSFDTGSDTGGKNIVAYLKDTLKFEIDPHAHQTTYKYPDVVYWHSLIGITTSGTMGGFTYDSSDWESYQSAKSGTQYPSYSWTATTLWGAASNGNHNNDDQSYGVWKPKSYTDFTTHDATKTLVYVGGGCSNVVSSSTTASSVAKKVTDIADGIASGKYSNTGFYTATIMLNVRDFSTSYIQQVSDIIDALSSYISSGKISWKLISEKKSAWESAGSQAFRMTCPSS